MSVQRESVGDLSPAAFLAMAEAAFASIPEELRRHVTNVVFHIDDFPDEEVMAEMELDSPYDLLGLYQGVALDQKSLLDVPMDVDRVFLYREAILDYCDETGETPEWVVRHVLIHEIGHHFGFSDDDMERIEMDSEREI